jgi:hypothetical protein
LEKEADDMADRVMMRPDTSFIQRKCSRCEEDESLQRKHLNPFIQKKETGSNNNVHDSLAQQIQSTKGGGGSLPFATRHFMERRFGSDFSGVRIHTDDYAANMSRQLNAQAFTVGKNIYFNSGKFAPEADHGKHLLAHELTHVGQQDGTVRRQVAVPSSGTKPSPSDKDIEFLATQIRSATDRWGTDEEAVFRALQELEQKKVEIDRLNKVYQQKYGKSLESVLRSEMSGSELQFALELIGVKKGTGLIKQLASTDAEFSLAAERLKKAMKGWGTDEEEIFAVLLPFRGNKTAMDKLKDVYQKKFNKDLQSELEGELSGSEKDYAEFQMHEYRYLEYEAQSVLRFIEQAAKTRAENPPSIDPSSHFYKRLKDHYLSEYFASPSPASGKGAIEKIGHPMSGRRVPATATNRYGIEITPIGKPPRPAVDRWEAMAITWLNQQQIPPLPAKLLTLPIFKNIKTLPKQLGAGTDILNKENWEKMKNIDVPHLIGKDNLERENFDADVTGGGKNISQLMHWATGVKYSEQTADAMHELFLAYELWHLEGFDVFGTDSLNDMIAEEQGRLLGAELLKGTSGAIRSEADLLPFLNSSFMESRAWVGSILRLRRAELDKWIVSKEQRLAVIHWDENDKVKIWQSPTIYQMLAAGMPIDDIKKSELVDVQIQIYALLFEADIWESAHGPVKLTDLQKALIDGKLNSILKIFALSETARSKGEDFSLSKNLGLVKGASRNLDQIGAGDVPLTQLK